MRGYLAIISNESENSVITNLIPSEMQGNSAYLGSRDVDGSGAWYWLDNVADDINGQQFWSGGADGVALLYVNWNDGEPNLIGAERCMEILEDGRWNNVRCGTPRPYICEFPFEDISDDDSSDDSSS